MRHGCRRSPASLACREHAALHPRPHLSERSLSHPSQAGRLCQATLLRLQHAASQSVLNLQSGSICCRSRRSQCAPQVGTQLRALNSPGPRSRWEQRAAMKYLCAKGRAEIDEAMIFKTTLRQREIEDRAMKQTASLRRRANVGPLSEAHRTTPVRCTTSTRALRGMLTRDRRRGVTVSHRT